MILSASFAQSRVTASSVVVLRSNRCVSVIAVGVSKDLVSENRVFSCGNHISGARRITRHLNTSADGYHNVSGRVPCTAKSYACAGGSVLVYDPGFYCTRDPGFYLYIRNSPDHNRLAGLLQGKGFDGFATFIPGYN